MLSVSNLCVSEVLFLGDSASSPFSGLKGLISTYTRAPNAARGQCHVCAVVCVFALAASVVAEAACWSALRVEGPGGITRLSPAVSPGFRLVPAPLRRWFQSRPAWAALDSGRLLWGALIRLSAVALGPVAPSVAVHVEWNTEAARKGIAALPHRSALRSTAEARGRLVSDPDFVARHSALHCLPPERRQPGA